MKRWTEAEERSMSKLYLVPEITAEQENYRLEPLASGPGFTAVMGRRDPVEPVPVGTYIVKVFRVTGYDPDCDGSLMARLAGVDRHGKATGWEQTHLGLDPDSTLIVDTPGDLWAEVEEPVAEPS
jgi:hypothetical protein